MDTQQYVKSDNKLNVEELSEGFTKYEEINLKAYATDDGQLDKYMLFKHPHKTEVKDKFEALVRDTFYHLYSLKARNARIRL